MYAFARIMEMLAWRHRGTRDATPGLTLFLRGERRNHTRHAHSHAKQDKYSVKQDNKKARQERQKANNTESHPQNKRQKRRTTDAAFPNRDLIADPLPPINPYTRKLTVEIHPDRRPDNINVHVK